LKYKSEMEERLPGTEIVHHDEMKSLVDGMSFVLENSSNQTYFLNQDG